MQTRSARVHRRPWQPCSGRDANDISLKATFAGSQGTGEGSRAYRFTEGRSPQKLPDSCGDAPGKSEKWHSASRSFAKSGDSGDA